MSHWQYLVFDGEPVPRPVTYEIRLTDVEADSGGMTEAGTLQRDVVREGVVVIDAVFHVTRKWLEKLSIYKKKEKMDVGYLDPATMGFRYTEMYVDDFRVRLVRDTRYGGLWEVRFSLREF